ncbi:MAG: rRNA maturation RNase YbeY [Candidatus Dormiibacterota bacterium]
MLAPGLSRSDRALVKEAGLESTLSGALVDLDLTESRLGCRATTPSEIRRLNRQFADSDQATDVLAFPAQGGDDRGFQLPAPEVTFLGDIVISVRTAASQAELAGADPTAELRLLAVHGLLHLLGYDHAEVRDSARMTETTQDLLDREAGRRGVVAPRVPALQPPP